MTPGPASPIAMAEYLLFAGTEGFDTADLKEAKSLLDELS